MGKSFILATAMWVVVSLHPSTTAPPIDNPLMATQYLMHYNYIKQSDMDNGRLMTEETVTDGVKRFQRFANITVTGKFDNRTMEKMNQPRCGVPDMMFHVDARRKRFAANARWLKSSLTWRIDNFTRDFGDSAEIEALMADALKLWADVSGLSFQQLPAQDPAADIIVSFSSFAHGDGNPFDGPGQVLAHAYFPGSGLGGDAHFDESEKFSRVGEDVNLFQVAVHEFGHSLGLGHSNVDQAVMAPFYNGYDPAFALHSDDIAGIQTLYGPNAGDPDVTMPPVTMPTDVPCSGQFDTITRSTEGATYAFRGDLVFKLQSGGYGIEEGFPRKIREEFAGLPNNLDASLFWQDVGKTYFFKGDLYWRFTGTSLDKNYPKPISVWKGLPHDIDAAFVWSGNGRTYFIKGDQYYRFNEARGRVDNGYPRPLRLWRGLPAKVDAALQWNNYRTYFFSGEDYYRFHDRSFRVSGSYPRSTVQYWIGCDRQELVAATTPAGGTNDASTHHGVTTTAIVFITAVVNFLLM